MLDAAIVIGWWAVGSTSLLWLQRGNNLTWGGLTACVALGFFGPVLWLVIALAVFVSADFWSKPIFRKRQQ